MKNASPKSIRAKIRNRLFTENTSGFCPGFVQGNLVILPKEYAEDFHQFCLKNPVPCPLLSVSKPGEFLMDALGDNIDIRTDVPEYCIFENGELTETVPDLSNVWRDDLVTFVLGCSFSFEDALVENGISVRNIEQQKNVSMFQTNIQAKPSKYFYGNYVVSMRPILPKELERAIKITSGFPKAHGAPLHHGSPEEIGINNIDKPDFGDYVEVKQNEIPVFWGCGVTPQLALRNAKLPFAITHVPGKMLITDKKYYEL